MLTTDFTVTWFPFQCAFECFKFLGLSPNINMASLLESHIISQRKRSSNCLCVGHRGVVTVKYVNLRRFVLVEARKQNVPNGTKITRQR